MRGMSKTWRRTSDGKVEKGMQIFGRVAATSKTIVLVVKPTDSIAELKGQIQEKAGMPRDAFRLIFGGRQLEDETTVASSGIQRESLIHISFLLRGGGGGRSRPLPPHGDVGSRNHAEEGHVPDPDVQNHVSEATPPPSCDAAAKNNVSVASGNSKRCGPQSICSDVGGWNELFDKLDLDRDGKVSSEELESALRSGDRAWTKSVTRKLTGLMHSLKDNEEHTAITRQEFAEAMKLSKRVSGALTAWQLKAWSSAELHNEMSEMDPDNSGSVDRSKLASFLNDKMDFGVWEDAEVEDIMDVLDLDEDGRISRQDFARAVLSPLHRQQLSQAVGAEQLAWMLVDALPLPVISGNGRVPDALSAVTELSEEELQEHLALCLPTVAARVFERLQSHRGGRAERVEQDAVGPAKFTFDFADVGEVEKAALNERLGLPSEDVEAAMLAEHADETEWTTSNYRLTTHPLQEYEFVSAPQAGKTYPGEAGAGEQQGRRRQCPHEVWRRVHGELPVEEALRTFRSKLGDVDQARLAEEVRERLRGHESEAEMHRRWQGELEAALRSSVVKEKQERRPEKSLLRAKERERALKAIEEEQVQREVRELQDRVAAWDVSTPEVKATMAYTGPMFEKYNAVLRRFQQSLEENSGRVPYKNTILMLISAVMKLRKRTGLAQRRVWRGLRGGRLPTQWVLEDRFGSKGGAERAFMSTSSCREEAAKYATRGGGHPVLLEMELGQIDKGADISMLSQYPGEGEILFPPATNLEVIGRPRLETQAGLPMLVLQVRANVSLKNETREELRAKRKQVLLSSLSNILQEVDRSLDAMVAEQPASLVHQLRGGFPRIMKETVLHDCQSVLAQYHARPPEWFEDDRHYQRAVQDAAVLKRAAEAKMREMWQAEAEDFVEAEAAFSVWRGRLLSVVNAQVLAELRRRWESARERGEVEEAREAAGRLCDWEGLVDRGDVDAAMDGAGNSALALQALLGEASKLQQLLDAGCSARVANAEGKTPLHLAARSGHAEVVRRLLDGGAAREAKDRDGMTGLVLACFDGHDRVVEVLVEAAADVQAQNRHGKTALIVACANGHASTAQLLLGHRADVHRADDYGWSALMWACDKGHVQVASLLLEHGAELNKTQGRSGKTPLMVACGKGHARVAEGLLERGAEVDARQQKTGKSALMLACEKGREALAELLVGRGADLQATAQSGEGVLFFAAQGDCARMVRAVVAAGVDVDATAGLFAEAALHVAAKHAATAALLALLDAGAQTEVVDKAGATPLKKAVEKGLDEVVALLASRGADQSPLLFAACERKDEEGAGALIAQGVSVDARNAQGDSVLSVALHHGLSQLVHLLKSEGADQAPRLFAACDAGDVQAAAELLAEGVAVDAKDKHGNTPLRCALSKGHAAVVDLLKARGADQSPLLFAACERKDEEGAGALIAQGVSVDARNSEGKTPLMVASAKGAARVCELLLGASANVAAADNDGRTALMAACEKGHEEIGRLLVQAGADVGVGDNEGRTALQCLAQAKRVAFNDAAKQKLVAMEAYLQRCSRPDDTT